MSKYISLPSSSSPFQTHNNPPYSIPGKVVPDVHVFDGVVGEELHKKVYEYLLSQVWHHHWNSVPAELQLYKPSDQDFSWLQASLYPRKLSMPRCLFASDEESLKKRHPVIWDLWTTINSALGDRFEITGNAEGMYFKKHLPPDPVDPNLSKGWRVYANASLHDTLSARGMPHRDTYDLSDETTVTILWVANPIWYPSWGGEILFYPEDPEGLTGDHQQFNNPSSQQQSRNFKIGWLDEGKIVSLRPGRLIVYDGRTLHTCSPTTNQNNSQWIRRVAFRARLKK